jgi:hypothetical protein
MVDLTLTAKLLTTEQNLAFSISISVKNQAAILSSDSFYSNLDSY